MATVTTPTAVRGLLVHDPRLETTDISADSNAGARPDQPTRSASSQARSNAVWETTGESEGTTRYIHAIRGGSPIPTAAGRWGYSTDGTSATQRGAWGRLTFTGYEPIILTAAAYENPCSFVTSTGRWIVVYYDGTECETVFRDADDTTVGSYNLPAWSVGGTVPSSTTVKPCALWEIPPNTGAAGRICLLGRTSTTYGTTQYHTFNLYYSDNTGTAWVLAVEDVGIRIASSGNTMVEIRAVYHGSYVTVVARTTGGSCASYTSYNGGASFVEIESLSTFSTPNGLDLVACDDGSALLVYIASSGAADRIYVARKSGPTLGFATAVAAATAIDGDTTANYASATTWSVAAVKDSEGTITTFGRLNGNRRYRVCRFRQEIVSSADVIEELWGDDSAVVEPLYMGSGASGVLGIRQIVAWRDGIYAVTLDSNATPFMYSLKFGGWSNVDWPPVTAFGYLPGGITVGGWSWVGSLDPAGCGWTAAGAGTGATSGLGGWAITTAANAKSYSRAGSASGKPLVVWARLRVGSGGSLTADDVALRLIRDTGAGVNRYSVVLRFSGTGARLYDDTAASAIGTITGLTSGDYLDVLFFLTESRATVYYKAISTDLWSLGPTGNATAAATASGNVVHFGNIGSSTSTSHWAFVNSAMDDRTDSPVVREQSQTRPTYGREMSARRQWLASGIYARVRTGPVLNGEIFTVSTVYDHGALDPKVYVADEDWRATTDASTVTITWTLAAQNVASWSTSIGICLRQPNFRTATLSGYDGASWTSLISIDTATGMSSLEFARTGYAIAPSGSAVGTRYVQHDEYAGCYAILVSGTTQVVLLEGNSAGTWRGTGGPQVVLHIRRTDPVTGAATDISTMHASGTIHLIPREYVAIAHGLNSVAYRSFRLQIAAQATFEDYFKLGRPPILGPFVVFGQQYARGRLIGPILSVRESLLTAGGRRIQQITRPRRYAELAWTDAIQGGGSVGVWGASPDPSSLAIYNSIPVAMAKDPTMIEGLLQVVRSGEQPVVYLPSVLTGSASSQFGGRELIMPAMVVGEPGARTGVSGDENSTEVNTIGVLRLEEIP